MLSTFSFSENTIGFIIDGPYDEESILKVKSEISEKLKEFDKINLYIEDTTNAEISVKTIFSNLPYKIEIGKHLNKVAFVSDRNWLHLMRAFESLFCSGEFRHFRSSKRLEAIQWISN